MKTYVILSETGWTGSRNAKAQEGTHESYNQQITVAQEAFSPSMKDTEVKIVKLRFKCYTDILWSWYYTCRVIQ